MYTLSPIGCVRKSVMGNGDFDNLADMSVLDEKLILDTLKLRYGIQKIYTYVGDILIAVNPFKEVPIYTKEISLQYKNARLFSLAPHIFAISSHAYYCMLESVRITEPQNQCIVISGESGAGKTESTKYIIKQIIDLCSGATQLEQQILQVNPLLEAFGNAKTLRNDNSSRFGKYIQLQFYDGKLEGAKISEYLLEKSRLVFQNPEEGNFHIFSYLLCGCPRNEMQKYKLGADSSYRYTKGSTNSSKTEAFYKEKYEELQNAMDLVGFSEEEQSDLFAIMSALLSVGNVKFTGEDKVTLALQEDLQELSTTAKLLGVDINDLKDCLMYRVTALTGEVVKSNVNKQQAEDARDAVAKAIYGRLFSWIVNKINQMISPQSTGRKLREIGVLDIFGFENFPVNSYEQACINLTNEHLQFFFNEHVFSLEQEEYKLEGIPWIDISYQDNQPLLDLFLRRPIGILSLLDEESHFPKGTDASFLQKLNGSISESSYFIPHKSNKDLGFTVQHYAGEVTYRVDNWLEKNRDTIPAQLTSLLCAAQNNLIRTIFKGAVTRTGTLALQNRTRSPLKEKIDLSHSTQAGSRKLTLGTQFKNSLQDLMRNMSKSEPHFIRCIKPNNSNKSDHFDESYVQAQLLNCGMLQAVQIRRNGFSFRPLIQDFISTYGVLLCKPNLPINGHTCEAILKQVNIADYFIGKSKVFLKFHHSEMLLINLTDFLEKVIRTQSIVRMFLAKSLFKKLKEASERQKAHVKDFLISVTTSGKQLFHLQQEMVSTDLTSKQQQDEHKTSQLEEAKADLPVIQRNGVPYTRSGGPEALPRRPEKLDRLSKYFHSRPSGLEVPISSLMSSASSQQKPAITPRTSQVPTSKSQPVPVAPQRRVSVIVPRMNSICITASSIMEKFTKLGYSGNDDDDDEVVEDDFTFSQAQNKRNEFSDAGSKASTVQWFQKTQIQKLYNPVTSQLHDWFHGILLRSTAELMLNQMRRGSFLVRLSERRHGYVLTFRAEDRCRNYLIDVTPSHKFVVVGEPKVHQTLADLVEFYRKNQLSNWNGLLTDACTRRNINQADYSELILAPPDRSDEPAESSVELPHPTDSMLQEFGYSASPVDPPPLPPKLVKKPVVKYVPFKPES